MTNIKIKQDSTLYNNYLEVLKGRVFKILPMVEEKNSNVYQYIRSLNNEFIGLKNVIEGLDSQDDNSHFISLVSTIESFLEVSIEDGYDHKFLKSEVFKCLNTINKMQYRGV